MNGFAIFDLFICLILIYFLMGIICNSAVEMLLTVMRVSPKYLLECLVKPLSINMGPAIINHTPETALSGNNAPDYIGAKNFTTAVIDKMTAGIIAPNLGSYILEIKKVITEKAEAWRKLADLFLKYEQEAIEVAAVTITTTGIEIFRQKIENWFDSLVPRVAGKLKRVNIRRLTFVFVIISIAVLNVDSISIAKSLYAHQK